MLWTGGPGDQQKVDGGSPLRWTTGFLFDWFSRTHDQATGDFLDATVLRKFGDVPDDVSALRGFISSGKSIVRTCPAEYDDEGR
jgi:hypothetical protein